MKLIASLVTLTNIAMCTVTMTFDVPETRKIVNKSWTEEFRGKWQDDNMTAEEFVNEIRRNRDSNTREIVELREKF